MLFSIWEDLIIDIHYFQGFWQTSLHNEIEKTVEDIDSGSMVYHLQNSKVLLGYTRCYGVEDNVTCDNLFQYIEEEDDGRSTKKTSKKSLVNVKLFLVFSFGNKKTSHIYVPIP